MKADDRWFLPKAKQDALMNALMVELPTLRAKLGISQGDLAKAIGISRQTYSSIECQNRPMSWSTYLALIAFFDYNIGTHPMIRACGAFPDELIKIYNMGSESPYSFAIAGMPVEIISKLDEAAFQSLRTVVLLEYARCAKISGESVIQSFNGFSFAGLKPNKDADDALKVIKERKKRKNAKKK